jgi:hypothetical protein
MLDLLEEIESYAVETDYELLLGALRSVYHIEPLGDADKKAKLQMLGWLTLLIRNRREVIKARAQKK